LPPRGPFLVWDQHCWSHSELILLTFLYNILRKGNKQVSNTYCGHCGRGYDTSCTVWVQYDQDNNKLYKTTCPFCGGTTIFNKNPRNKNIQQKLSEERLRQWDDIVNDNYEINGIDGVDSLDLSFKQWLFSVLTILGIFVIAAFCS